MSSSQAQSRTAYLESKKQKEKLELDQQKMIHEKKMVVKTTVSPMIKPVENQQNVPSTHSKGVSPVLISRIGSVSVSASIAYAKEEEEEIFFSIPSKADMIDSELHQSEHSAKVVASLTSFEEALSTSFGSTTVRPRSVPFPKFEEWK